MSDTTTQAESICRSFSGFKKMWPLRKRLALWNVLIFLLSFLILGCLVFVLVTSYLETSLDKRLSLQSEKMQMATTIWFSSGHQLDAQFFSQLLQGEPGNEFTADNPSYIKFIDIRTGKTLYHSYNLKSESFTLDQADAKMIQQGQNVFRTYQQDESQQVRTLTFPIWNHAHAIIAIAQVGGSLASINEMQHILLLFLGGGMLAAALLAYVISSVVANRELRPLSNLSTTLLDLSADGPGVRLAPTSSATEIQQLTDAFNQMTERLESSLQLQRQFVADISHELRTPLTNIRGQIDILLMDRDLKADVYRDVRAINIELKRVSWLLTNLLLIARAEVGIVPELSEKHVQAVEIDTLLIEILRQLQGDKQTVVLEMGQLEQTSVKGDRELLKHMILNILDNALHYTLDGGRVSVELTTQHDFPGSVNSAQYNQHATWATIHIRDTGPGIAPEDMPNIFEHYYRAAQSNSRSKHGAGLGLFVSRLIARAHGGDITVDSELMKGSCFYIWLPMSR
ncbi:sensor histidine kinase [Dictyobacter formicarum]|uniref:histidine kinase n=1 Tax=Dictyobacter formicarum TaxID=2778368 RepID=A0ABQ3VAV8_9CHLR|nr:HAMP domain-containing sensor histidine kinase [Dictyobacter formicarum]GHO83159.1 two-component sensor histidine kinase [Dictyobacter formicarum]